ncbi:MAG: MFS transporter [Dehalococcoidia bacterium]
MFRLRRLPFYHGWVMVGTALAINAVSSTLNPVVFSFMIGPMSEELGVPKSALAWSFTLRLFAGGLVGPLLGVLLDRHGARWMGVVSGTLVGSMLIALAFVHDLWLMYLVFAISGLAGLGGPAGQLLTQVPLARWFVVKRGRALAIATMGMAGGTVGAVPLTGWLLGQLGWRGTTFVFGVVVAAVVIPVSALLVRRSPEDLGLHPDGAPSAAASARPDAHARHAQLATAHDWTVREAMRTRAMWQILGALVLAGTVLTGTLVYRVAYFTSLGISPEFVAFGTTLDPFSVVFSSFAFGMIADRVPVRYLGAIGLAGLAASTLPMILSHGEPFTVALHGVTWGVAAGGYIALNNLVWPNYFGRLHLGAIRGVVLPASIAASGLGAPLFGYLLDSGMAPARVWLISAIAFALAAVAVLFARPPRYPGPAAGSAREHAADAAAELAAGPVR